MQNEFDAEFQKALHTLKAQLESSIASLHDATEPCPPRGCVTSPLTEADMRVSQLSAEVNEMKYPFQQLASAL